MTPLADLFDEIDAALKLTPTSPAEPLGPDEVTVTLYAQHIDRKPQTAGKHLRRLVDAGKMTRVFRQVPGTRQKQWVYRMVRGE